MPYLKINHDDSNSMFEELNFPEDPMAWLDACHNALGCSSIQTASTVFRGVVLIIDEEGKLWDGWENRINIVASILHGSNRDPIVGDAILAQIDGENLVPLSPMHIDILYRRFGNV